MYIFPQYCTILVLINSSCILVSITNTKSNRSNTLKYLRSTFMQLDWPSDIHPFSHGVEEEEEKSKLLLISFLLPLVHWTFTLFILQERERKKCVSEREKREKESEKSKRISNSSAKAGRGSHSPASFSIDISYIFP